MTTLKIVCLFEPIPDSLVPIAYGPRREKTCLRGFANNKGANQPAHPRSLISAFVISLLKSITFRLALAKFHYSI